MGEILKLEDAKQVGWIRVGALGDLLIATSALRETCRRFSNAKVWVIGPRLWLELLSPSLWPQVSGVLVLEAHQLGQMYVPERIRGKWNWKSSTPVGPLSQFIEKCDAVVNHRIESYRYSWTPWLKRIPIRIGSCPWPMKWLYTHWSPWLGKDPVLHERDWHLFVARAPHDWREFQSKSTSIPNVSEARELFARHFQAQPAEPGLPLLKDPDLNRAEYLSGLKTGKYILINPTSSRREKAWPAENFRSLLLALEPILSKHELHALVVGSPKETEWLKSVAEGSQTEGLVSDQGQRPSYKIVQPENLQDLMDLVSGARLLLTNTSSMQFIAAAQKIQTLTLMGQANPTQWGPLGANDAVIQGQVPAEFSGTLFERDLAAYQSISVESVVTQVLGALNIG